MVTTFLLVLAGLALFHLVYEGIVAPSLRLTLRNKLFELRDQARALQVEGVAPCDRDALWFVHDGINHFLNRLPCLTLQSRVTAEIAYRSEDTLRERVARRAEMLRSCKDDRIKKLFKRTTMVVEEAFVINMGGWLIYVVPLALLMLTFGRLKRLASSLVLTPETDAKRILLVPSDVVELKAV